MLVKWKCTVCGYTVEYESPPEQCPYCGEKCSFIDNSCYTPDCGLVDRDYLNKTREEK